MIDWKKLHGRAYVGRTVLVTGGCGFIGSHLVDALLELGAKVRVLDDLSSGLETNISALSSVELYRGSILDQHLVSRACLGCNIVFHLAAMVSVPASVANPSAYQLTNVDGTFAVLESARQNKVSRFVFSASSSAYGDDAELPKRESMPTRPCSPYAATKAAGEMLVRAYARSYDMDGVNLRYFNIFGPRQRADSPYSGVIAAFASRLLKGLPPRITGDGTASRDFTFVANAVHANLLAGASTSRFDGDVFNVATGKSETVQNLARRMILLAQKHEISPEFAPARPGDVPHSLADLGHARNRLGYTPIVDFEVGLAQTWQWYESRAGRG